jgi:hypothetical protein
MEIRLPLCKSRSYPKVAYAGMETNPSRNLMDTAEDVSKKLLVENLKTQRNKSHEQTKCLQTIVSVW